MKTCAKCHLNKNDDLFTKRKTNKDGLHPYCRECKNASEVARRAPIREQINSVERDRYLANPEPYREKEKRRMADPVRAAQKIASQKEWLSQNAGKTAEYCARHREKHLIKRREDSLARYWRDVEINRKKMLEYQKNNRSRFTANSNMRYAGKLKATPPWLTKDHKAFMQVTYAMAEKMSAEFGYKFHVDHIHPLRGQDVCGLHVPWNLQVIPAFDNQSKGNRLKAA